MRLVKLVESGFFFFFFHMWRKKIKKLLELLQWDRTPRLDILKMFKYTVGS